MAQEINAKIPKPKAKSKYVRLASKKVRASAAMLHDVNSMESIAKAKRAIAQTTDAAMVLNFDVSIVLD